MFSIACYFIRSISHYQIIIKFAAKYWGFIVVNNDERLTEVDSHQSIELHTSQTQAEINGKGGI
jgi:hypothetical protein